MENRGIAGRVRAEPAEFTLSLFEELNALEAEIPDEEAPVDGIFPDILRVEKLALLPSLEAIELVSSKEVRIVPLDSVGPNPNRYC